MIAHFFNQKKNTVLGWLLGFIVFIILLTACSKPPLKIGFIATLSGRKADLGIHARNGVQLAVDFINSSGGLNGRMINLIVYDDRDSRSSARIAFSNLTAQDPEIIIGPVTSVMADAIYDLIVDSGIPVISPSVTASKYQDRKDNFYLLMPPNTEQGKMIGAYLLSKDIKQTFGVFDLSNRSYAEGVLDDTVTYIKAHDNEDQFAITKVAYDSQQNTDYRKIGSDIAAVQPDAIIVVSNGLDAAYFVQSFDLAGYTGPVIGSTWTMSIEAIPLFGELSDRIKFVGLTNPNDQSRRFLAFHDRYLDLFKINPLHIAIFSYDAVQLIKSAAALGRDFDADPSELFTDIEVTTGCQVDFHIDNFGDSNRQMYLLKIQGQTFSIDE